MNEPVIIGNATLYCADCREILPTLLTGTVITDPPYNIGMRYSVHKDNMNEDDYYALLDSFSHLNAVVIHYAESLFKISWMREEIPTKVIAWVYNSNMRRQWRGIGFFGVQPDLSKASQPYKNPSDPRIAKRMANGETARLYDWWYFDQVKNISAEKTEHPCQIPMALMDRLLLVTPGDPVIDPFMGCGSTAVAAVKIQRRFIGIEIDPRYFDLACQRIEDAQRQMRMVL